MQPCITCFDFIPIPPHRPALEALAEQLELKLAEILPASRFDDLRVSLAGWPGLDEKARGELSAALGWRAALFLDDGWLWEQLDFGGAIPARPARDTFRAWAVTKLGTARRCLDEESPPSDPATARANAERVLAGDFSRDCGDRQVIRLDPHRTLAEGYRVLGKRAYADAAFRLLADLTWDNPGGVDALDVAHRTVNLLAVAAALGDAAGADETVLLWKLLYCSGLRAGESWHPAPGSPSVHESSALGRLGFLFSSFLKSEQWRAAAQARLAGALRGSILSDGSNVEGSLAGQAAYLACPQLLLEAARQAGLPADPAFEAAWKAKVRGLVEVWAAVVTPSRTLPQRGAAWPGDVTPFLVKYGTIAGSTFARAVAAADTTAPDLRETFRYLPVQRFAAMRGGWGRESLWAGFNLRGFQDGGEQDDLFALEVQEGSVGLLLDEKRRASAAHHTLVVDGGNHRPGPAVEIRVHSKPVFDWVEGLSVGSEGVLHRRAVCFMKPGMILVLDRVMPRDDREHRYDFCWHLPAGSEVVLEGLSVSAVEPSEKRTIMLQALAVEGGSFVLEDGLAGPVARLTATRSGGFSLVTVIRTDRSASVAVELLPVAVFNAGEGQPVPEGQAVAVRTGNNRILWCEPGYGEKKIGEWTTDGDWLMARGWKAWARGASVVSVQGKPAVWEAV